MRTLLLLSLSTLVACNKRCDSSLDGPDTIAVTVEGDGPSIAWDGGPIAMLDVWVGAEGNIDTGMGHIAEPKGEELLWRLECDYVAFQKRMGIRQNCISGPVVYGQAPAGVNQAFVPKPLPEGEPIQVIAHRYPEDTAQSCYAHDDGTALFSL